MPSRREHLEQERANAAVERAVLDAGSPAWACTVLFYRAVHLVEASFAQIGLHHRTHHQRSRAIAQRYPALLGDYLELLEFSRAARYEPLDRTERSDYEAAQKHFTALEEVVRRDA